MKNTETVVFSLNPNSQYTLFLSKEHESINSITFSTITLPVIFIDIIGIEQLILSECMHNSKLKLLQSLSLNNDHNYSHQK